MNLILLITDDFCLFSLIYIGLNIEPACGVNCLNRVIEGMCQWIPAVELHLVSPEPLLGGSLGNLESEPFFGDDWFRS